MSGYKYYKINVVSVKSGSTFRANSARLLPATFSAYSFGTGFTKVDNGAPDFYAFMVFNTPHQKIGLPATLYFAYDSPTIVTESRLTAYNFNINDTNVNRWELYGSNADSAFTSLDSSTSGWTLLLIVDPAIYVSGISTSTVDYYFSAYAQTPNTACSTQFSIAPPPGSIMAYLGGGNATGSGDPAGWVIADGTVRTDAGDGRYNYIASTLGIGSRSGSNYTPPDLRGCFMRGAKRAATITPGSNSNNVGVVQTDEIKSTSVNTTQANVPFCAANGWLSVPNGTNYNFYVQGDDGPAFDHPHSHSVSFGSGTETRPYNIAVNWIIKY